MSQSLFLMNSLKVYIYIYIVRVLMLPAVLGDFYVGNDKENSFFFLRDINKIGLQ